MPSKVAQTLNTGRSTPTRQKTLDRHTEWWELRRQGYTIYYIAARFKVTPSAVSYAMSAMERNLYKVLAKEAEPMRARQTAILESNLEKALLEWERSKENAEGERIVEKSLGNVSEEREAQPQGGSLRRRRIQSLRDDIEGFDLESIPGYFSDENGDEVPSELRPRIVADYLLGQMERGGDVEGLIERTVTRSSNGRLGDPRFLAEIRAALSDIRKLWGLDAPTKQDESRTRLVEAQIKQIDEAGASSGGAAPISLVGVQIIEARRSDIPSDPGPDPGDNPNNQADIPVP